MTGHAYMGSAGIYDEFYGRSTKSALSESGLEDGCASLFQDLTHDVLLVG